jgi:MmyB-like transcription regulator ligand binding domain
MPLEDRNCLWLAFTHPAWRSSVLDWEEGVARLVAQYRAAMAEHLAEPRWRALVRRLSESSPEFVAVWDRREVLGPENRTKRLLHPEVGLLSLDHTSFWLGPLIGTRLIAYVPCDDTSREGLEKLAALHPPHARLDRLDPALDGATPS